MLISFIFALLFLLLVPLMLGFEPLGILGLTVGCLGSWIVIAIAKSFESQKESDTEIIGTYVTEARYYEPWTEKIKHEDKETGKVTYEIVEHDEVWEMDVAEGEECIPIDEEDYLRYVKAFGGEEEEEADHEWEAEGEVTDPGYCYTTRWPGTFETACYEYVYRSYVNPTLRSSNVYTAEKLDEDIIKSYHLTKYGEMEIYGTARDTDEAWRLSEKLADYNCWFREKNIKLNFILLKNAKSVQAMYWQQYWKNGKRNTINAVVGLNDAQQIEWAHVFGWQNESTCIKLRDFLVGLKTLDDITENFDQVEEILQENYELADFKQYDFMLKRFPYVGTFIALSICLGLFCGLFGRPVQLNERGQRYIQQGQYQAAYHDLREYARHYNPDNPYVLNNLGVLLLRENLYEGAEEMFARAMSNRSKLSSDVVFYVYRNQAICYQEMKEYKKAIKVYKDALEYTGDNGYNSKSFYCGLYNLYKEIGYKKSIWSLNQKYNRYFYRTLREDCQDYQNHLVYLYEEFDPLEGRGIGKLIHH